MASKIGFMKFLRKKMAQGGEVGGDPGYGQPYNRKNSHGEPHTNQYFEDEHPMSYMDEGGMVAAKDDKTPPVDPEKFKSFQSGFNSMGLDKKKKMAEGGMVSHYNHGEPDPDQHHDDQSMSLSPDLEWEEQMGEPDPANDHDDQESPDLSPHPMAMNQIHPGMMAEGGMVYHHQSHTGEEEEDQSHPDMDHEDAMDPEMAHFAHGGKAKFQKSKGMGRQAYSQGGTPHHRAFAHALMKKGK